MIYTKKYQSEVEMMNKQYEVNAFCTGMIVGINTDQEQRCDIRIRKRKSWKKLERMRCIRLWNAS